MSEFIQTLTRKLVSAIEVCMSPNVNHQQRNEAYMVCEDFKANSPHCAQCGFDLSRCINPPIIRHFGLQLLEHCIKFRWNSMPVPEKAFIKNSVLDLIANGTLGIQNEEPHIKSALARIVVEMIKREWPQQWPSLLEELDALCDMGETQTELVFLIFLFLAEDTIILQTVPNQRRREIFKTLNHGLTMLFPFFIRTLKTQYMKYQDVMKSGNLEYQQVHGRLVETVLITLGTGFLEWCPMVHVTVENFALLPLLCSLLSDNRFRLATADCLIALLSRKVRGMEAAPFLNFFTESNMNAICYISNAGLEQLTANPEEEFYTFVKRMCLVHTSMGSQLVSVWGDIDDWSVPTTFPKYMQILLAFTQHPSKFSKQVTESPALHENMYMEQPVGYVTDNVDMQLTCSTCAIWLALLQHKEISTNEVMLSCLPHILEASMSKLAKTGYPSRHDSPSCSYARFEFDNDEDFHNVLSRLRSDLVDIVRAITVLNPTLAFEYSAKWLQMQISKPIDIGESEQGFCNYNSPTFVEWDALAIFMESVNSKMMQSSGKPSPSAEDGLALMKGIIEYHPQDPMILSAVLSCISSLFVFMSAGADCLPAVLNKIFSIVVYTLPGQTKATRQKPVKNVRRHACSSLIKICKQYPGVLLPVFDEVYSRVKQLSTEKDQLSQLEKCTLFEVLVLISNEFHDYERQAAFLREIITPIQEIWMSLRETFMSVEQFMTSIGIDSAPVMPSTDDYRGIHRSQILLCLNFIVGVIKRSQWPSNIDVARNGKFYGDFYGFGDTYRNPATPSVLPALPTLFCLIRVLNQVCTPEARSRVHPEYAGAFSMTEVDRNNVLGSSSPCNDLTPDTVSRQPWERMQTFFATMFDLCYHILGNAGPSLGVEFYCYPNLSESIFSSMFDHLEIQADFRLRTILRVSVKPFIQHCPHYLTNTVVVPLLGALCPLMLKKLSEKWKAFTQRYGYSQGYEDEMTENQEILEDKVNRILTREYVDLLGTTISSLKRPQLQANPDSMEDDASETVRQTSYDKLSELGLQLLAKESLCSTLVATLFSTLHWDSVACVKSAHLCWPTLKQLVAEDLIQSEQEATYILQSVIHGLQIFGEHEANRAVLVQLGTQIYELLRPKFPGLSAMLQQVSACSLKDVQALDEKILNTEKPLTEKKKRELFKNLVHGAIGVHVSEQFKQEIEIRNLAPIMFMFRKKNASILETESNDVGLCNLFKQ